MPRTHVIVNTHTPERLRRTLLGVLWQRPGPATLTISCDSDHAGIEPAVRAACIEASSPSLPLALILRPHTGKSRPAQARNNAVRHLLDTGIITSPAGDADTLIFFDGDCVPAPGCAAAHTQACAPTPRLPLGRLSLGWRYDLTPEQDAAFDESALRDARVPFTPTPEQLAALDARHARYLRQARLQRLCTGPLRAVGLRLVKEHKPKVLGANFACTLGAYSLVNGSDETYEGWAQEDDDLGRRLYRAGLPPAVGVRTVLTYHQYHQTRAPQDWRISSNARRLDQPCQTVCARGLRNPLDQPTPQTIIIAG